MFSVFPVLDVEKMLKTCLLRMRLKISFCDKTEMKKEKKKKTEHGLIYSEQMVTFTKQESVFC